MSSWRAIKRSRSLPFVLLLTLAFSAYSFLPSLRIPSDSPARPRLTEPQWAELVRSSSALCDDPFRAPGILTLNWDNLFRIFYDPAEGISHKIQMGPIFDHSGKQSNYDKGKGGSCLDRPGLGGPRLLERLVRVSRKEENEKGELNDSDLVIDEEDGEFKGVGFLRGNTVALLGEEQDYNHLRDICTFLTPHKALHNTPQDRLFTDRMIPLALEGYPESTPVEHNYLRPWSCSVDRLDFVMVYLPLGQFESESENGRTILTVFSDTLPKALHTLNRRSLTLLELGPGLSTFPPSAHSPLPTKVLKHLTTTLTQLVHQAVLTYPPLSALSKPRVRVRSPSVPPGGHPIEVAASQVRMAVRDVVESAWRELRGDDRAGWVKERRRARNVLGTQGEVGAKGWLAGLKLVDVDGIIRDKEDWVEGEVLRLHGPVPGSWIWGETLLYHLQQLSTE